ncbi:LuxR C-terminal-related transcriptional regulator [uncultured Polaribacter sp.]|uniref:helix-turn-helix transcriptional regulator n=1 Tax=uncultured Polaribacter sp. TaxID=174711 RepID=UPI00263399DE|nr:LuxR C-terminal-related transcriptional regulator [uncultured Polaribacter sp.]
MINNSEITNFSPNPKIAGLMPYDSNIEFVGIRKTKQVLWLQNGSNHYFSDLPVEHYNLLKTSYLKDHKARRFLEAVSDHLPRQVELYTYYMYGEVDSTPDISNGKLAPSENFRDTRNCPSLLWNSKNINIGNHILTPRQLVIVDLIGNNLPDKAIASVLGVSHKTLDFHKSNLFKAVGVSTKMELLKLSIQHKIIA